MSEIVSFVIGGFAAMFTLGIFAVDSYKKGYNDGYKEGRKDANENNADNT